MITEKTSLFTNQLYSFRVAPWIDTNSVIHSGGANGHVLNLVGTGFTNDMAKSSAVTCNIGTVACKVLSVSSTAVTIELPPYQVGYENLGKLKKD
jgi:hypothetical protein